jgi:2-polyprenyl-3-methyl-5-hydroxy-6-metoxy-1,4-benzoquinol methylase
MTMESAARVEDIIEVIRCPNCGSAAYHTIIPARYPPNLSRADLLKIYSASSNHILFDAMVRCHDCSLVYLNPRIRKNLIIEGYSDAADPTFIAQNDERIATFKKSLRRLDRLYGISPKTVKRVLDVGCAGGAFPKAANDLGIDVIGVEPSRWLVEQGRAAYGLDLRAGLLADQHFPDQSFDLVCLWDVIEHMPDAGEVIDDIFRLLKPGGYFIVNYPDHGSLARKLLGRKWPMLLSVHLIYFTRATITAFLRRHNFEVVEIHPFWQTLKFGYVLRRASSYFSVFGLLESLADKLGLSSLPITYNIGQSFVLARKP